MRGARRRAASRVQAIGFKCRTPNPQTVADTALGGSSAGTVTDLACASNEVLVGVEVRSDEAVFPSIAAMCALESDVRAGSMNAVVRGSVGTGTKAPVPRRCPANMAVKSFRGRSLPARLGRIELTCQHIDAAQFPVESMLAASGASTDGSSPEVAIETCARRGVMRSLSALELLALGELDAVQTDGRPRPPARGACVRAAKRR